MKKSLITIALVLALSLSLMLCLVACGDKGEVKNEEIQTILNKALKENNYTLETTIAIEAGGVKTVDSAKTERAGDIYRTYSTYNANEDDTAIEGSGDTTNNSNIDGTIYVLKDGKKNYSYTLKDGQWYKKELDKDTKLDTLLDNNLVNALPPTKAFKYNKSKTTGQYTANVNGVKYTIAISVDEISGIVEEEKVEKGVKIKMKKTFHLYNIGTTASFELPEEARENIFA